MAPNILLIHCHDIGAYMGPYGGNDARTPNVDQLAAEGVVLEQHFAAAPTCSPSRASMVTGLVPHRHGLMGLQNGAIWNMDTSAPTIASQLAKAGYDTACFGVWHVNARPYASGFGVYDPESQCELVAENVKAWLADRDENKPFFAMAGFFEPHRVFTDEWGELIDEDEVTVPYFLPDIPETRAEMVRFYGDVSRADAAAGQILAALDEEGLNETTLVMFTADHGIAMPWAKGTLSDRGSHIGGILRWPGRIPAGSRYPHLTSNVDLLPTFLAAAGADGLTPAEIDGQNVLEGLCGQDHMPRGHIFSELTWHDFYEPMRSVRTERYKLIRNFEIRDGQQLAGDIQQSPIVPHIRWQLRALKRPSYELYDLAADPHERENLAGIAEYGQIEAELKSVLLQHLESTSDPILVGPVDPPRSYWEFVAKSAAGLP